MELQQFIGDDDRTVRRVTTDDDTTIVADLGPDADPVVEVVEDTVIVAREDEEFDVDLPAPAERAFIKNGVLTIELEVDQ